MAGGVPTLLSPSLQPDDPPLLTPQTLKMNHTDGDIDIELRQNLWKRL